jgi:hypothetical protein
MSQAEYFSKPLPVLSKLADVLRHFPAVRSVFARVAALWRGTRSRGEPPAVDLPDEAPAATETTVDPVAEVVEPPAVTEAIVEPVADVVAPPAVPGPIAEPLAVALEPAAAVSESTVEPMMVALQPPAVIEPTTDPVADVVAPPNVTERIVEPSAAVVAPSAAAIAGPETDPRAAREQLIRRRWAETGIKMWNPDVQGAGHGALSIQGGAALLPPKEGETLPRYDRLEFRMVRSETDGQQVEQIVCEGVVVDPPKRKPRR